MSQRSAFIVAVRGLFRSIGLVALMLAAGNVQAVGRGEVLAQGTPGVSRAASQHLTTGFPLRGAHENTRCESCHLRGIFKGTPKECISCHGPGARISTVTMTPGHPPVAQPCTVCHNQVTFTGIKFDHSGVMPGSCASCHNGAKARGKALTHIVTTQSCDACHTTMVWAGATFDHNQVMAGTCATCHNGTNAQGKPANHLPTSASCDSCHRTTAWKQANFNHGGVTAGTCGSCHNGTGGALGTPAGHIPTAVSCDSCHSTTSFAGTAMKHAAVAGTACAVCHDAGKSFTGVGNLVTRPANHVPTTAACEACHVAGNFTTFASTAMSHAGISSGCATCHDSGKSFTGVSNLKTKPATHIPTTATCESCHAAGNFASFGNTAMNHTAVAGTPCATCHETGKSWYGVTIVTRPTPAVDPAHPTTGDCGTCHTSTISFSAGVMGGKPANHIPTNAACTLCHADTKTYKPGVMNHAGIASSCATCHAAGATGTPFYGVTPLPQMAGHIPTNADCVTCHASTAKFGPGTAMNHAGISSGCATCHDSGKSFTGVSNLKTKPATHIPTTATCESCHAAGNFASFGNTAMNHTPVAGTPCATCHETGKSWYGVTIVTRPTPAQDPAHPTTGDCGTCHTSTISFSAGVTGGKPANHIPTNAACTLCHADTKTYKPGVMNHAGISSGCTTCHAAGVTGTPFYGVTPLPQGAGHIPTSSDCVTCHASTAKFGPGTAMNHTAVAGTPCATCHETGKSWYGVTIVTRPTPAVDPAHPTTGECGTCHSSTTSFTTGVTGKPANHIPTNAACTLCHLSLPASYKPGTMNHSGISSGCTTCHAASAPGTPFYGVTPLPQGAGHIPTNADCVTCHASTAKFGPGTAMNHAGISSGCATCHDSGKSFTGVTIKTKPGNHLPTNAACETCHAAGNFTAFGPNTPMNHAGISSGCTTCHAAGATGTPFYGVTPLPQGAGHIPTNADCVTCHASTAKFGPGTAMNHAGISSGCASCHDSGKSFAGVANLKTKPATHIPTTATCESCHAAGNFASFGNTAMNHTAVAGTPCATCHETGKSWYGVTIVTRPTPAVDPAHPTTGECGTCHSSTTSFTTGVTGKPANHIPTNAACTLCHLSLPASYKPGTMNHSGISSGCTTCHAAGATGTPFYGVTPLPQGAGHIPTSSDCVTCHASTAKFGPGTAMNHTAVAGTPCATCHETGKSWYGVTIVTRPTPAVDPAHPTTGECGTCHSSTTSFTTGVTGKPANHIPTNAACTLCHLSLPASYKPGTMNHSGISSGCTTCHAAGVTGTPFYGVTPLPQGAGHIPSSSDCVTCHASTAKFGPGTAMNHAGISSGCASCHDSGKSFAGVANLKTKPATHIPTTATCESCHAAGNFASFGNTAMNHTAVAGTPCATCHETGKSWYGVTIVTRPTPAVDPAHPTTGECGTCHSSTTSFTTGVTGKPANHIPTNAACTLCHLSLPASYKPGTMNHSGISSGCTTCHAAGATGTPFYGVTPLPQGAGHIPTNADCVTCHASTAKFGPGTAMNHAGISSGCATCHDNGKSFTGVTIKTKPGNHLPTNAACETCHAAGNFTAFGPNTPMNHAGISSGCTTCHAAGATGTPFYGVTPLPQGAGHIPTNADCVTCHASTAKFGPGTAMNHAGISSGCASCHDSGKSFAGVSNLKTKPATHIPTTATCESCHAAGNFASFGNTAMNHTAVAGTPCATCHETGKSWYGVTIVTRPTPAVDPAHPTTGECGTCHSSTTSFTTGVTGKPANHIPTNAACTLCHLSLPASYKPGTMNHSGISSGCTTCHAAGATGTPFYGVTPLPQGAGHIPTNADCVTCHASTAKFGPGTAMNHAGISSGCATCHDSGKSFTGVTIKTKPGNHLPTNAACETCHAAGNFTAFGPNTPMNHAGISSGCTTCHAAGATGTPFYGVTPLPQGAGHIPTNADCVTCHASTAKFGPGTAMNHAGISSGCASCHDSGKSFAGVANLKTKPATHIPTTATCESCHAAGNFASFGNTAMNHTAVAGTPCATCHETGKSWYGVTIVTRPTPAVDPAHPTTGECGTCHSSTTSFTTGVTGKPANHIPTNAACTLCHLSLPASYKPGTMNHSGISSGCTTCHAAGATGTPFYGVTPLPQGAGHIPTSSDCVTCHASTAKFGPGTAMNHAGISSGCATCHDSGKSFTGVTIKTKPGNHLPTNAACEACHAAGNFTAFGPNTPMNHAGISSGCTTCHAASMTGIVFAGVTPLPQGAGHIPTNADCATCHASTAKFGPGTAMNHTAVAGTPCATCHETGKSWYGVTIVTRPTPAVDPAHPTTGECGTCHSSTTSFTTGVTGKPANHIPTNAACTLCHLSLPASYKPGTMNHSGISSGCTTCHAAGATGTPFYGVTPLPQGAGHIPTNADCVTCHASTAKFGPGTAMNHAGISSGCATCHDNGKSFTGVTIKTKPGNHLPTSAACETCHAAGNFTAFGPNTPMNHAGISSGCTTCHAASTTGIVFAGVTPLPQMAGHIPTNADCATCHASTAKFGPGTAMNHTAVAGTPCATCHETGKSWYGVTIVTRPTPAVDPAHPTTGECGTCHSSTTSFTTGVTGKPANHIPTNAACTLCHLSLPASYKPGTMNHSGISSGCTTCHAAGATGTPFYGVTPLPQGAGHIPTSSDCVTCHASTAKFGPGTAMNHAGIGSGCATCHDSGKSFTGVTIKTKPANHIPTTGTTCESCHAPTNFTTFAGTKMNHAPVAAMTCMTCHETGMSWYGVNIVTRPHGHHTGVDCKGCHIPGSKFDDRPTPALLRPPTTASGTAGGASTPGGGTTGTASSPGRAVSPTPMPPSAAPPGVSPVVPPGAPPLTRPSPLPSPLPPAPSGGRYSHMGVAPASCISCHNGASAKAKPARHLPTALSCDACHRTTAWTPANFTHTGIAPSSCVTCHNGTAAKGRPANHFVTTRSCDSCHRITGWTPPGNYMHVSPAFVRHSGGVTCVSCHTANNEVIAWKAPAFKPDCAGCHANRFKPEAHVKVDTPKMFYTLNELRNCTGACHVYANPSQTAIKKSIPPRHRATDGGF